MIKNGSWLELENRMIFTSSGHPRTVESLPELENRMIFAWSAYPYLVNPM